MTVAQGTYKILSYKKQTGLGSAASGSGGQKVRRETATFSKTKSAFNSDEITSHQQYTGDTYGTSQTAGTLNADLSPKTYSDFLQSLMRDTITAGASATGVSLTIAAGSSAYTITRATGSWLTDGFKAGDVVQITAGAYTGVARNINLVILTVNSATIITVIAANGKSLSAQGPIATSTIAVVNKKMVVPDTSQTNDYYSIEEFYSDASLSRLYTDMQIASADITVPANGNAKAVFTFVGLGRTKGASQVLTTPTTETTTSILSGENAVIVINGAQTMVATQFAVKIDGQLSAGEPVIASKTISDNVKGDIKVTGTVTVLKQDETNSNLFDNETPVQIIAAIFVDATDSSDFVSFSIPRAKLFTDEVDDGKKQLTSTHSFTAEHNSAGGAALATDTGIISIQDSAA